MWQRFLEGFCKVEFLCYQGEHPTPDDFFAVADEVAGQDLSWFFDQVHRDSVSFDYAITRAKSSGVKLRGWVEQQGKLIRIDTDGRESTTLFFQFDW